MTVYKYLGYGVTNENGVAKLEYNSEGQKRDHSYTGVGAGEIDVIASTDNPITSGSIVSETFSVMDTLLYDTGTDPSHNIWTGSTSNLTRGSEYSRLEESTIGTPVQINTVMPTGLWVLTMSIKRDGHSTNWDLTILNNNVSVFGCATPTNDVWTDITLVYDGSFIYYFENGSTTPTKKTSVMLDDTKNTVLRLQTPQDITYLDFKDLIVLREGKSAISIGSTTPIIQSGSTATINGSLYESGLIVKNATLDVYKNGTKVGTASTGDSGVASYTYTGVADGEVEFQFKYGSIVSETYSILDCIKYDKGILDDPQTNDIYDTRDANSLLTRTSEYSKLTEVTTGTNALLWISSLPSECTVDFEFMQVDGLHSSHLIRVHNNNSYKASFSLSSLGYYSLIVGQWIKLRLTITDGSATLTSLDDTSKTKTNTFSGTGNRWSIITTDGNTEIHIRNVEVY